MTKCDTDKRYGMTLVASNLWNINNTDAHTFTLNYFINGKKINGYPIMRFVYEFYERETSLFEMISASQNTVVIQYKPNSRKS